MSQQPQDVTFNQPSAGGGYFEPKNAVGHLVLITKVHDVYHNPSNIYAGKVQPRDEAKVDLVDLDAPGQEHRERVIVTHPGLTNRLVNNATNVLGRIGTVPTDKGNDAFVLNPFEGNDADRAAQWVRGWQAGQFSAPAAPPADNGWAGAQGNPNPAQSWSGAPPATQQPQAATQATAQPQGYQNPPQAQGGAPGGSGAAPGTIQLPPGVDPAQLAAIMAQLSGQPVQQDTPPF